MRSGTEHSIEFIRYSTLNIGSIESSLYATEHDHSYLRSQVWSYVQTVSSTNTTNKTMQLQHICVVETAVTNVPV